MPTMAGIIDLRAEWANDVYAGEFYVSREHCLNTMRNRSSEMTLRYCKPEWDSLNALCWGPTPEGMGVKLRCPDDGFLNPNHFATRTCLSNAKWYVNKSFDNKPYTDFSDCFLFDDPTHEENLKKLVGDHIMRILKYMDNYEEVFLTLHIVSIVLLVACTVVSAALVLRAGRQRQLSHIYCILAVAAIAMLLSHATTISVTAVGDALEFVKCRVAKSLVTYSVILLYECLFVYLYLCIARMLNQVVRELYFKAAVLIAVLLAFVFVFARQMTEIHLSPGSYCGFRHLQSTFHWLTTAPKILLLMCVTCLELVTIFGAFCLKQPHLEKSGEVRHVRQMSVSALVVILCSIVGEVLLILIHTEEYLKYSEDALIDLYIHAFSLVTSIQGIIFSVWMCFLDLRVLAILGLSFHKPSGQQKLHAASLEEVQDPCLFENAHDQDNETDNSMRGQRPGNDIEAMGASGIRENLYQGSLSAKPQGPPTEHYESKLTVGPLKSS